VWKRIPAGITVVALVGALVAGALIARKSLDTAPVADQQTTRSAQVR
jgi:hypothetical protein